MSTMNRTRSENSPSRTTYRHGDLKRALIEAGLDLARDGGPDAVVLREATRRAGVVPNAAYRHFANREDLLMAVRAAALVALAKAIEAEHTKIDPGWSAADRALASLSAVGTAYLAFAEAEPGLFRTAFAVPEERATVFDGKKADGTGPDPYALLAAALDRMVAAGVLPAEKRPGAEMLAWSSVHGLATLLLDGPLSRLKPAERQMVGKRLIAMVVKGL